MKRIYLILFILSLFSLKAIAQEASIRGKVIDKSNGEELIGATVLIEGTSIGCSVDLEGNYNLSKIKPGKYNIRCQYIAYEAETMKDVYIEAGENETINFTLKPSSIGLNEIEIVAKASRRTENAILHIQKKAANLIDAISAQQISKAGDNNAASALKRVTGLSVQEGKYVFIRGLSDRYMLTTLNGAEIPSLDPNKNTIQMDIFPSNILETIIVNKSFSPELPGSFSGGLIDIITRNFPETFQLTFSSSLSFNNQTTFNNNYIDYSGSSTDFLGFDNGKRKIPNYAKGNIPRVGDIKDYKELTNITSSFNKNWKTQKKTPFFNNSYSFSLGNQTLLLKKPLGYFFALSYSNSKSFYNNGIRGRYQLIDGSSDELVNDYSYNDIKSKKETLWSAITNLSYKITSTNQIGLVLLRNQSGSKTTRILDGPNPEIDPNIYYRTQIMDFVSRSFSSAQLKGEHQINSLNKTKINWLTSYTFSNIEQPDFRNFNSSYYIKDNDTINEIDASKYAVPSRFYRDLEEQNVYSNLKVEIPFISEKLEGKIKFGGSFSNKNRTFRDQRFDFKDQNNSFKGNIEEYFSNKNIGVNANSWKQDKLLGVFVSQSEQTNLINSYNGQQKNNAAFIMTDLLLFSKLRLITGARLENTNISVNSLSEKVKNGKLENSDILPALSITYKLNDRMNIRLAYSKTIAKPNFRELAPYASFDFMGGDIIVGNPKLSRTLIHNYDFRWELFQKPGEIIAFSAFYKNFDNPIEKTYNPEASNPELTWRNVKQATLIGVEFEYRKNLTFIHFLRNIKIGTNVSFIKSAVNVDKTELEHIHKSEPNYPEKRVMAGQSPFIINAIINYNNPRMDMESNLSFNIFGKRLAIVNGGGTPNIYEQAYPLLNFNISKGLNKYFKLKFSVSNILNPEQKKTFSRWNETNTWKNKEYIYSSHRKGRSFSISLTYAIR
ncbi:MAG: TonB-dependent receptor domain-containing protein [Bacteroidales bacterium]